MSEFRVQFDVFDGPLDLLLYLVRKQEVDIYDVNMATLANDFIHYVERMKDLDIEVAGEFLVMAATLLYIKSKELLPVEKREIVEDEEEEEDPRWELIRQLVEYKKYKDAAAELEKKAGEQDLIFPRIAPKPTFDEPDKLPESDLTVLDLLDAVSTILKRFESRQEDSREIVQDRWTVSDKISQIRSLLAETERVRFEQFFEDATNRVEVVVTFLAMLELIRMRVMKVEQSENFGEIDVVRRNPEEDDPEPILEEEPLPMQDELPTEGKTKPETADDTPSEKENKDPS